SRGGAREALVGEPFGGAARALTRCSHPPQALASFGAPSLALRRRRLLSPPLVHPSPPPPYHPPPPPAPPGPPPPPPPPPRPRSFPPPPPRPTMRPLRLLPLALLPLLAACEVQAPAEDDAAVTADTTVADGPYIHAASEVEAGRYYVVVAGCNDCHTPGFMENADGVPEAQWLTGMPVGF